MVTTPGNFRSQLLSTYPHARSSAPALIVFLTFTLFATVIILSGCAGVTSAKGNSASVTTNSTNSTSATANSVPSTALSASPTSLSFGKVSVGSTNNQSLTITNSGTSPVTISQATASGAGFAIGGMALPLNLNPGNSATFTARFVPTSTGNVSGAASISGPQLSSPFLVQMTGAGTAVAPSITVQPISVSILVGQAATFSVNASGTAPLNYQWYKNSAPITGAVSSTYATPSEPLSDNGAQFSVVVSNSAGNITSNTATLSVTTAPVAPSITTQPVSQSTFAGQTATFSVTANGTAPLSYQWRKNGTPISAATSASYTTSAEPISDSGALFSVVVSNSAGSATSNNASLTVNPDPVAPSITAQPASRTITAGQTAAFSVTASGTAPLNYQWQKNGVAISGATSSTYTTLAETASDSGAQFAVVVSNGAGSITSNTATLTVNAAIGGVLTPSTTTLSFGNVTVNTSNMLGVTLTNSSSVNITVSSLTISGAGYTASGVSNGQIITPGQAVALNVTFAPAATGSITGNLTVTSNASNSPIAISLSGNGVLAHTATLNWTASTSTVIGYNVYRGTVSGGPYTLVNSSIVAGTQYVDSTVMGGQTYYYVATAVALGNVESTYSSQVVASVPTP